MSAKKRKQDETSSNQPSFEESLEELQEIVQELEEGSIGLQDSMERFERGMGLFKQCYHVLEKAEQRIELLTGFDSDGNPEVEDFDSSSTIENKKEKAGRRKRATKSKKKPEDDFSGDTLF
jgi:exodeoxyribonuclease VII small subunit